MLPTEPVTLLPLIRTCENVWSGQQGSVLRGKAAFPAAAQGPLYLLIYFHDCCLTSLGLLPQKPLQWLIAGQVLSLCLLGAVRGRRAACLIWGHWEGLAFSS